MKVLVKSFVATFVVVMLVGVSLLISIGKSKEKSKEYMQVQNTINKIKREVTEDDIINILQLLKLNGKNIFTEISINPIKNDVIVNDFPIVKTSYNNKNIEELYNYGGINLVLKIINKDFNKNINRYLIIKNESILKNLLDVVGSIEVKEDLMLGEKIKKNGCLYSIVDSNKFINIINKQTKNNNIFNKLIREYFIQKTPIICTDIGEETFKKAVNIVESNISFYDFYKLKEININLIGE